MSPATLQSLAGAAAFALLLGAFGPTLDAGPYDDGADARQATQVADAVEASRAQDIAQCRAVHGPNAAAVWLPDGQHRCTDKHGRRLRPV